MIVGGLDLSKNHFALVLKNLLTKKVNIYFAWDSEKKAKEWDKKLSSKIYTVFLLPKNSYESKESSSLQRYQNIYTMLDNIIYAYSLLFEVRLKSIIIGIENYAYGASAFSIVPIAEMTGCVKVSFLCKDIPMRLHDPLSVKMWAGDSQYQKEDMIRKARKKIDIPEFLSKTKNNPASDIADAYFIMKMVEAELRVRANPLRMNKLKPHQKALFNRVTKANPVNILSRPFISRVQPIITSSEIGFPKKKNGGLNHVHSK